MKTPFQYLNDNIFLPKKIYLTLAVCMNRLTLNSKMQLKEDYEKNVKNKKLVRIIKNQEKETSDAKEKTVACFDLVQVSLT